jgi:rhodanese-related sulfurtransferase
MSSRRSIDELLAEARGRIERVEPAEAWAALQEGAMVIDTRDDGAREREGVVPGSLHVPRTVLEWRLDPEGPWRSPHAPGLGERVLVICDHGFSSSLAAATLVDMGYERAGDVVGGFEAWVAAGLPTAAAPQPAAGVRPGMAPPS